MTAPRLPDAELQKKLEAHCWRPQSCGKPMMCPACEQRVLVSELIELRAERAAKPEPSVCRLCLPSFLSAGVADVPHASYATFCPCARCTVERCRAGEHDMTVRLPR